MAVVIEAPHDPEPLVNVPVGGGRYLLNSTPTGPETDATKRRTISLWEPDGARATLLAQYDLGDRSPGATYEAQRWSIRFVDGYVAASLSGSDGPPATERLRDAFLFAMSSAVSAVVSAVPDPEDAAVVGRRLTDDGRYVPLLAIRPWLLVLDTDTGTLLLYQGGTVTGVPTQRLLLVGFYRIEDGRFDAMQEYVDRTATWAQQVLPPTWWDAMRGVDMALETTAVGTGGGEATVVVERQDDDAVHPGDGYHHPSWPALAEFVNSPAKMLVEASFGEGVAVALIDPVAKPNDGRRLVVMVDVATPGVEKTRWRYTTGTAFTPYLRDLPRGPVLSPAHVWSCYVAAARWVRCQSFSLSLTMDGGKQGQAALRKLHEGFERAVSLGDRLIVPAPTGRTVGAAPTKGKTRAPVSAREARRARRDSMLPGKERLWVRPPFRVGLDATDVVAVDLAYAVVAIRDAGEPPDDEPRTLCTFHYRDPKDAAEGYGRLKSAIQAVSFWSSGRTESFLADLRRPPSHDWAIRVELLRVAVEAMDRMERQGGVPSLGPDAAGDDEPW